MTRYLPIRSALACVVACGLVSGCSATFTPKSTDASTSMSIGQAAVVDKPTKGVLFRNDPDEAMLAGPPNMVGPAANSMLNLTKPEICSIIDPQTELATLQIPGTIVETTWRQSESSSECSVKVASDASEGFLEWRTLREYPQFWPSVQSTDLETTTALEVQTFPARFVLKTDNMYAYIMTDIGDHWMEVAIRDLKIVNSAAFADLAEKVVGALVAIEPSPQPALTSRVSDSLALSAGQVCSLISNDVLRQLGELRAKQPPAPDIQPDSYTLYDGFSMCTRGQELSRVAISEKEPYGFPDTKPDESGYTQPYVYGNVSGKRRRELDGTGAFIKTVATVPFQDRWVEVEIRDVPEGSKLDAILKQEVAEVLANLTMLTEP